MPCGAESCPEPRVARSTPVASYSRTTSAEDVTQTLPSGSMSIPVAPLEVHDVRRAPAPLYRATVAPLTTQTLSEASIAISAGLVTPIVESHDASHPPEDVNFWIRSLPVSAT